MSDPPNLQSRPYSFPSTIQIIGNPHTLSTTSCQAVSLQPPQDAQPLQSYLKFPLSRRNGLRSRAKPYNVPETALFSRLVPHSVANYAFYQIRTRPKHLARLLILLTVEGLVFRYG